MSPHPALPTLHPATTSCLPDWLGALLDRMEVRPVRVEAGRELQHKGDRARAVYVVERGCVYAHDTLSHGRRQITTLSWPGEVAGLSNLNGTTSTQSLRVAETAILHPVPNPWTMTGTDECRSLAPELASHLLLLAVRETATMARTLTAVGRLSARDRVLWFLLMVLDRQTAPARQECGGPTPVRAPEPADARDGSASGWSAVATGTIRLPLTQTEVGDCLGLTNVSVSKTLSQLSEDGAISRQGGRIVIRRIEELRREIGYSPMPLPPGPALRLAPVLLKLRVPLQRQAPGA